MLPIYTHHIYFYSNVMEGIIKVDEGKKRKKKAKKEEEIPKGDWKNEILTVGQCLPIDGAICNFSDYVPDLVKEEIADDLIDGKKKGKVTCNIEGIDFEVIYEWEIVPMGEQRKKK